MSFSLYIHIPFCSKKCDYCHFYVIPEKETHKDLLLQGLTQEWQHWLPKILGKQLVSIYLGGGTPYLFGPERIRKVIDLIRRSFDISEAEITLEANPENITVEGMKDYLSCGINRVSIGLQTLDAPLLQILGRTHRADQAYDSVLKTFDAGIRNISVDLMYDLPGQTLSIWNETIKKVRELPITHLSLYNLTFEPHTLFFKHQQTLKKQLPDPETSTQMYIQAIDLLQESGLQQYEISAFARSGLISQHNTGYWTGRPFLGLGPSAFSYWENKRFRNVANLNRYAQALEKNLTPVDFEEMLDTEAQARELFVLQLRLKEGVSPSSHISSSSIEQLLKEGYLEEFNAKLRLTKKGILFYDTIASELI